ncbi:hypothetical protein BJX70DRAFT_137737 [Aspergillus crustosus]
MVDPISIASLAYPIATDLFRLAGDLNRIYNDIRHAKEDLHKAIERIRTTAQTYTFFQDTMNDARKMAQVAPIVNQWKDPLENVKKESRRVIRNLKNIKRKFWPLTGGSNVKPVDVWVAQCQWAAQGKKAIVPLFTEMQILERSMQLLATLVHIQIALNADQRNADGQAAISAQIKYFLRDLEVNFEKLRRDKQAQAEILRQKRVTTRNDVAAKDFAQEVLRMLEREIPKLNLQRTSLFADTSTPDSGPSMGSQPQPAPSTPPSSDRGERGTHQVVIDAQKVEETLPRPRLPLPDPSDHPKHPTPAVVVVEEDSEREDNTDDFSEPEQQDHGPYVPTALFGPPKPSARPPAGHSSIENTGPLVVKAVMKYEGSSRTTKLTITAK